ncbi:brachyurin-like [Oratosquilla oratoria]|uniref:brachyurin-like n=1 Tax=Oratosquilla oratoria TaxID=337810 RepID=UPI003F77271F
MYGRLIIILAACLLLASSNSANGKLRYPTVTPNSRHHGGKVHTPNDHGTWRTESCGTVSEKVTPRIVGGTEATPHAYPWQAALFINSQFCGGALISDEWVLTAAQCTNGASLIKVTLGAHNIQMIEPTQVSMTSYEFYEHDNNMTSIFLMNDIALIKLPEKVPFNEYIQPVCLPHKSDKGDCMVGKNVTVAGWGMKSDNSNGTTDKLRKVEVPVISNEECSKTYGGVITTDILCTSGDDGKGTCTGDSGGPLSFVTRNRTEIRGIVSFRSSEGCENGYPDAFTRVTEYLDWIENVTAIAIEP